MGAGAAGGQPPPIEACRIKWTKGRAYVPSDVKRYGKRLPFVETVDFKKLGVSPNGLLGKTLDSLPLPCHAKRFRKFNHAVQRLAEDPLCRQILSAPLDSLSTRHIVLLFDKHEQYLKAEETWTNKMILGAHFRAYFCRNQEGLSCGSLIADIEFRSMLGTPRSPEKVTLISESFDPSSPEGFRAPISSLPHSDLTDLEAKAKKHLAIRLDRIEEACWTTIDQHLALAVSIREKKLTDISDVEAVLTKRVELGDATCAALGYRVRILQEASVETDRVAAYALHWIEKTRLYERPAMWGKAAGVLSHATGVSRWANPESRAGGHGAALFSDYFLSQPALLACQYLLQIEGGWNPDTVRALTPGQLQRESDGSYTVRPFKPKSDQYLPPKHFGKTNRVHRVLELLLEHRASVDRLVPSSDPSLFVAYQTQHKVFGLFNPKHAHKWLLATFALTPFSAGQLRDQRANSIYLEDRDILRLKEYLGHADLQSVDTYLNHSIQRVLSAANMEEFTRRLDQAVRWVVDASPRPECENTAKLLFPIDDAARDCRCDEWLSAEGEIVVGAAEIAHCVWQRAYYIKHFERLRSENSRRFASSHLSRVVFCMALYHLILNSPHRYLIEKFEAPLAAGKGSDR